MKATIKVHEEHELQARTVGARYLELDALRGLAAVCVVYYHFKMAFDPVDNVVPIQIIVIRHLLAGHQSVILFFVLSGFVLSIPLFKTAKFSYRSYLVRRFCRIYLPFLGALILSWAAADHFLYSRIQLTQWFHFTWQTPLTWRLFGSQLLMAPDAKLNTAFWSLRYEVEMSILFPLICLFMRGRKFWANAAFCVGVYGLGTLVRKEDASQTLLFAGTFILGAILSLYKENLKAYYHRLTVMQKFAVLTAGLVFYFLSERKILDRRHLSVGGTSIGAGIFIILAINSTRAQKILLHAVPEYLGRISYSLYLVHGTVLFALINLLYGRMPTALIFVVYSVVALLFAHLFCLWVEEPAMRLGKKLTSR